MHLRIDSIHPPPRILARIGGQKAGHAPVHVFRDLKHGGKGCLVISISILAEKLFEHAVLRIDPILLLPRLAEGGGLLNRIQDSLVR